MATVKIDPASLSEMRAFYQGELQTTLARLQHIQSVLEQIGDSGISIAITTTGNRSIATSNPERTPRKASTARKRKGKPGPKSKWDKMVLSILKSEDKPFTYDQLTDVLLKESGKPDSERVKTKATVQNTIFKLRGKNKVMTFSAGNRVKFIGLSEWFASDGNVDAKYAAKVPKAKKAPAKKKAPGKRGRPVGSKSKKATVAAKKTTTGLRGRPRKVVSTESTSPAIASPSKKKEGGQEKAQASGPKKAVAKKPAVKKPAVKKTVAKKAAPKKVATPKKPAAKTKKASVPATTVAPATPAPVKKKAPKKVVSKKAPAKKAKARKTPARGLSQAKAVQLPGDKPSE